MTENNNNNTPPLRPCSVCNKMLDPTHYSKSQLAKHSMRKCHVCLKATLQPGSVADADAAVAAPASAAATDKPTKKGPAAIPSKNSSSVNPAPTFAFAPQARESFIKRYNENRAEIRSLSARPITRAPPPQFEFVGQELRLLPAYTVRPLIDPNAYLQKVESRTRETLALYPEIKDDRKALADFEREVFECAFLLLCKESWDLDEYKNDLDNPLIAHVANHVSTHQRMYGKVDAVDILEHPLARTFFEQKLKRRQHNERTLASIYNANRKYFSIIYRVIFRAVHQEFYPNEKFLL